MNENPKYKNISNFRKLLENLPKYLHIDFQIWFPKYKFLSSKYIKNVDVQIVIV